MSDLVEIEIPFSGFYETLHDMRCDDAVEGFFTYNNETGEEQDLPEAFWDADINWAAIRNEYCEEYVKAFADEFDLTLTFLEMTSPREYNFTSDRIFVNIPREQMDVIKDKVFADDAGRKYIQDTYTSYSGFWSHYSNDLTDEEWTRETLDECQYGTILKYYVESIEGDGEENWYEREATLTENFEMSNWSSVDQAVSEVEKTIKELKEKKDV